MRNSNAPKCVKKIFSLITNQRKKTNYNDNDSPSYSLQTDKVEHHLL